MDTVAFEYGFLGIIILMVFFAFLIWTQKMLQVILATTGSTLVILWWSGTLHYFSYAISQQDNMSIFGFEATDLSYFIQSAELTTSILIFIWLLIFTIQYSSSLVNMASWISNSRLVQFLLSPLAIFSMIVSLSVAVLGIDVFSLTFLQSVVNNFGAQSIISYFVQYLPICIMLQGVAMIFLLFQKHKAVEPISYDDI